MSRLEEIISAAKAQPVIGNENSTYCAIDLSENALNNESFDIGNAASFENFVERHCKNLNVDFAVGGYKEKRNIYKRSSIFNDSSAEERNIHMGIDIWAKAATSIIAPLDGIVHSFQYNEGVGNYGPTIILEHEFDGEKFFTLYGHLSEESISTIKIGDKISAGQTFCHLGDASVNGDYAPHLHFQIIGNMGESSGDFAGVCAESELEKFCANCPDPNLLLKINLQ